MSFIARGLNNVCNSLISVRPSVIGVRSSTIQTVRYKRTNSNSKAKQSKFNKSSKSTKSNKFTKSTKSSSIPTGHNPSFKTQGKFSKLDYPSKKVFETSSVGLETINSFNELRIFPTVRQAMIKEIKDQYNLKDSLIKSREELDIKPTPCQIATIRKINIPRLSERFLEKPSEDLKPEEQIQLEFRKENELNKLKIFALASETGSGKTWAYLASILSKLKEDDWELYMKNPKKYHESQNNKIIRAVILVPTYELVHQVTDVLRRATSFDLDIEDIPKQYREFVEETTQEGESPKLRLRIFQWLRSVPHTSVYEYLRHGNIDVLVTTPGKIIGLQKLRNDSDPFRIFRGVKYCVIDEADTLFDVSWIGDTIQTIRRFRRLKDLVFCSATIPNEFKKTLISEFPGEDSIIEIATPSLHKISRNIKISIIDAQKPPFNGSIIRCLAQALYAIRNDGTEDGLVKRIVVFVNKKEQVSAVKNSLVVKYKYKEEDIITIQGNTEAEERQELIQPFIQPAEKLTEDGPRIKVLITTDLLGRGINFYSIKNVIMLEMPNSSLDMIHRIGRTGRMGQSGRVLMILDNSKDIKKLVGVPKAALKGVPIG
ncbi:uncharacterized protein RJT21DRAFT_119456 [Scheffersomyces amazonensis]|uniref:uncharacterized protein n=1 Tax=Scheffersomyces amazonensis TaxID=1078765 RepID=UPI00315C7905